MRVEGLLRASAFVLFTFIYGLLHWIIVFVCRFLENIGTAHKMALRHPYVRPVMFSRFVADSLVILVDGSV